MKGIKCSSSLRWGLPRTPCCPALLVSHEVVGVGRGRGMGDVWGGWCVISPPWSPSPHPTMHGWSRSLLFNIITAQIDDFISSFQKIKVFNEDIGKLIEGEEIVMETESRLCNKIREEFTSWILILTTNIEKGKSWDRASPKATSRLPRPEATSGHKNCAKSRLCPY